MRQKQNRTNIPKKQRQPSTVNQEEQQVLASHSHYQGPVPPPSLLAGYEGIHEGFANRIITLAEKESEHRHKMEEKVINAQIEGAKCEAMEVRLGQICALIIGIVTIVSGTYTALHGAQIPGIFFGTSGVAGLVTAFIMGRHIESKKEYSPEKKALQESENKS